MRKKNIPKAVIIKITLGLLLIILAIYANVVAIKRLAVFAIEVDFYNKLSVAYDLGGREGVKTELSKIEAISKLRRELRIAAEFRNRTASLEDPKGIIENSRSYAIKKINMLLNLRRLSIILILVLLVLKFFILKKRKTQD